jgi:predicted Zn-dependent protease
MLSKSLSVRTGWIVTSTLIAVLIVLGCVTNPETGKRSFAPLPESMVNNMALEAYQETLQSEKVSTNSKWNTIVQRVADRIAKSADQVAKTGYQWECNLVENPQANAFCMPGGKMMVYTGILPICETEAGLAFVMGHEVGHAVAQHGNQRMSQGLLVNLGLQVADISFQDSAQRDVIMQSLGMGSQLGTLYYSRGHESEADYMGLRYMARAGYDPTVGPDFWKRMGSLAKGEKPPEILSTHPSDDRRAADLAANMAEAKKLYDAAPTKYGLGDRL